MSGDGNQAAGVQNEVGESRTEKTEIPQKSRKVLDKRPTDFYRFFDASGDLIYIGISSHGLRRMFQHKKRQPWFDEVATIQIEKFKSRRHAQREEKRLIKLCVPRYNIQHAPTVHLLRRRIAKTHLQRLK